MITIKKIGDVVFAVNEQIVESEVSLTPYQFFALREDEQATIMTCLAKGVVSVSISGVAVTTADEFYKLAPSPNPSVIEDITITVEAGATNVTGITVAMKDSMGNVISDVAADMWFSDDSGGVGAMATSFTGAVAGSNIVLEIVSKKVIKAFSGAITVTDTATTACYFVVQNPSTGKLVVAEITADDYGTE